MSYVRSFLGWWIWCPISYAISEILFRMMDMMSYLVCHLWDPLYGDRCRPYSDDIWIQFLIWCYPVVSTLHYVTHSDWYWDVCVGVTYFSPLPHCLNIEMLILFTIGKPCFPRSSNNSISLQDILIFMNFSSVTSKTLL